MTYIDKRKTYRILLIASIGVLFVVMVFSSTLGVANISFSEAIQIMLSKIPGIGRLFTPSQEQTHNVIVLKIRLPRILLASLIGIGLSVVGSSMQGMFKNPMADPGILGISTGAALGATLAIVTGVQKLVWGIGIVTIAAFAGALLTTFLIYSIARVGNKIPTITLLLSGVAVSFLFSSMITMLMVFNREQIENIVLWTMGSIAAANWRQVWLLAPIVLTGTVIIMTYARDLNLMATGDETAQSLGVEVEKAKKVLLVVSAVLVGACVSVSGIIGFVGLIIPHMVRLLLGSDHRSVLPFSAVGGALFMVICDTLARNLVPPAEMPVGAITSLFGAPFFIYLLIKSKKKVI